MALSDTLNELAGTGPARRNRVSILLDKLHADSPEDYETLVQALKNMAIPSSKITAALRHEYGKEVVKDSSVAEYRRSRHTELTGL